MKVRLAVSKKVVDFDRKSTTFFLFQNALISMDYKSLPYKATRPEVISGTGFSCFRRSLRGDLKSKGLLYGVWVCFVGLIALNQQVCVLIKLRS